MCLPLNRFPVLPLGYLSMSGRTKWGTGVPQSVIWRYGHEDGIGARDATHHERGTGVSPSASSLAMAGRNLWSQAVGTTPSQARMSLTTALSFWLTWLALMSSPSFDASVVMVCCSRRAPYSCSCAQQRGVRTSALTSSDRKGVDIPFAVRECSTRGTCHSRDGVDIGRPLVGIQIALDRTNQMVRIRICQLACP